jgi:glycosyltransferase involved in cell wall biosynthesis
MKIGIHNESCGAALGGSEVSVAVLAEALAKKHQVEILHHRPALSKESLAEFAEVDLHQVDIRLIPRRDSQDTRAWEAWARYRAEKEEDADLTKAYDLFITFNHGAPPFCAAPIGVLVVLFPFFDPNETGAESDAQSGLWSALGRHIRLAWHKWKLKSRLSGYQEKVAISEFTQRWTKRRWNTHCEVVFPPAAIEISCAQKSDCMLSVGRFAIEGHGHSKNQIEMLQAFKRLKVQGGTSWQYDCVGACGSSAEECAFLEKARALGAEAGANVEVNLDRTQLKRLYQRAKIFWHAAGMDINERLHPELAEHFGMTTAEAMAAGCVPVVINKGGQPEIVEHGISGFLWNTLDELQQYTAELMQDDPLFQKMSRAARQRARLFSREAYVTRFCSLLGPHLSESRKPPIS